MFYNAYFSSLQGTWTESTDKTKVNLQHLIPADIAWTCVRRGEGGHCRLRYDIQINDKQEIIAYKVSGGWVVVDFDLNSTDNKTFITHLNYVLEYIRRFVHLNCIPLNAYKIFFSGNKGFHLYIREEMFGLKSSLDYPHELKAKMDILIHRIELVAPFDNGRPVCTIDKTIYNIGKIRNPSKHLLDDRKYFYTECTFGEQIEDILKRGEGFTENTLHEFIVPNHSINFNVDKYPECLIMAFFCDELKNGQNYDYGKLGCRHKAGLFLRNKMNYLDYSMIEIQIVLDSFFLYHKLYLEPNRKCEFDRIKQLTQVINMPCKTNRNFCTKNCKNEKLSSKYTEAWNISQEEITATKTSLLSKKLIYKLPTINISANAIVYEMIEDTEINRNIQGVYKHLNFDIQKKCGFGLNQFLTEDERIIVNNIQSDFHIFPEYQYIQEKHKNRLCPIVPMSQANIVDFCKMLNAQGYGDIYVDARTHELKILYPNGVVTNFEDPNMKYTMIAYGFQNTLDSYQKDNFKPITDQVVYNSFKTYCPIRNVLEEYFNVKWDGIDRISNYLKTITLDAQYHSKEDYELCHITLFKLFLTILHGQLSPYGLRGCVPPLIVFAGDQGIGKTTFALSLIGDRNHYQNTLKDMAFEGYRFNSQGSDLKFPLTNKMILEMSECDKWSTKSTEIAEFKSILLSEDITARRLYEKQPITLVRRAVIIGSTNKLNFIPSDLGDRRVAVFKVSSIDWRYLHQMNMQQFWSQVYHIYRLYKGDINKFRISVNPNSTLFTNNIRYYAFPDVVYHYLNTKIKAKDGHGLWYNLDTICVNIKCPTELIGTIAPKVDEYLSKVLNLERFRSIVKGTIGYTLILCGVNANIMMDEIVYTQCYDNKCPSSNGYTYDHKIYTDVIPQLIAQYN